MAWFDIFAFGVTVACIVISMTRGVIVEVVALVTWIASFIAARMFAEPVSEIAFKTMQPRMLATALSFVLVFAASLLVLRLLRSLLTSAVSSVGLGGVNRILGGMFGALKGVLIVTVAVLACSFTDLPESDGWRKSVSAPFFETLADAAVPYLKGKRHGSGGSESDNITDSGVQDAEI
ncbi:CvpA family protein [Neisseria sp.]|uniref:CvpA family protein n=1 Tax=Neisseria sp. TaxID=192066 RepID=UPI0035A0DA5A